MNLYGYVGGDPVNAVDLLGLIDINLNLNNNTVDGKIDKRISGFVINAPDVWDKITVYAHGDSNRVGDMRKGFPGIKLTPQELADIIKNHKGFKDAKEIVLYSCSNGKDPNGFATQLSKLLGLPVWAPNDFLWIRPDGKYTIGSHSTLGIAPGGGKFIKYE